MELRPLGNTGIHVSALTLGTVELGMPYGFRGGRRYDPPDRASAIRLIHRAIELGINLIDTAPAYGESEAIVGEALRRPHDPVLVATKVTVDPANAGPGIRESVESSLRTLGLETIDLLQIHNSTVEILCRDDVLRGLENAVAAGKVRFAGTSVYKLDEAQASLAHPFLRTLQIPFNLLDQGMRPMLAQAQSASVGVLARSVFLRGVLTDDPTDIPDKLMPLREAALKSLAAAGKDAGGCAELAVRFCLSAGGIASVLIGVRSIEELEANVAAAQRGPLQADTLRRMGDAGFGDDALLSPMNWTGLI